MPKGLGDASLTASLGGSHSNNPNKWLATFTPSVIGISLPVFECYRIVIKGGPAGSTFDVYIGVRLYDSVAPGDTNSWDPNQPMKLQQGDVVEFRWNTGSGSTGPQVWMYFQEESPL